MKMMILAPRRAGMTHDEFRRYVTEVHGPLVKSITEVADELLHYHYNFPVVGEADHAFGHPLADLDIVTQGYFESREAQLANMQHPRFKTVLRPDEQNFADTARAMMHYTDETVIWPGERSGIKLFCLRRRAPGLSRGEFQERWRESVGAVLESLPIRAAATSYVQNHVQAEGDHPDGTNPRHYDVIDEFWFSSREAFESLSASVADGAMKELEGDLLDTGRTRSYVATMVPNIR